MGCVLSSPVELIRVQRSGSTAFRCAVAEMQGWRTNHEDAHAIWCDGPKAGFWVLDGHGGDGAALFSAPELSRKFQFDAGAEARLPSNETIEKGFQAADDRLRSYFSECPDRDSGSTVVGAVIARKADDTYDLKLLNCGDSRALVVRRPTEDESSPTSFPVRIPQHLSACETPVEECPWPVIAESIDHKPNHPTEKSRIEAAGGSVSEEEPPRLDGNLAVSRGLGDFEYKADSSRAVAEQKVSCIPDIYEVSGLPQGTICVLACDGVWDVQTGKDVADHVRNWLAREPDADLGDIAASLVQRSLQMNSRDNVTAMIISFSDGSDWEASPDEMINFEKLSEQAEFDDDVRTQYTNFLRRCNFPAKPAPCAVSNRWFATMSQ